VSALVDHLQAECDRLRAELLLPTPPVGWEREASDEDGITVIRWVRGELDLEFAVADGFPVLDTLEVARGVDMLDLSRILAIEAAKFGGAS
jgi:hypothetical protein